MSLQTLSSCHHCASAPSPSNLLPGLPPSTPHLKYTTLPALHTLIQTQASIHQPSSSHTSSPSPKTSPLPLLHAVPSTITADIESRFPENKWHIDHDPSTQTLLVETMVTGTHKLANFGFHNAVLFKTLRMNAALDHEVFPLGSAEARHGPFVKEPDMSWGARGRGGGGGGGVAVCGGGGWGAEGREKGENDARVWWRGSRGWLSRGLVEISDRTGVAASTGEFRIPFRALFDREPDADRGEHDVVLSARELEEYAAEVWDEQWFEGDESGDDGDMR